MCFFNGIAPDPDNHCAITQVEDEGKVVKGKSPEVQSQFPTDSVCSQTSYLTSGYLTGSQASLYFGPIYFHSLSSHLHSTYPISPPVRQATSHSRNTPHALLLPPLPKCSYFFVIKIPCTFPDSDERIFSPPMVLPSWLWASHHLLGDSNHILPGVRVLVDTSFYYFYVASSLKAKLISSISL